MEELGTSEERGLKEANSQERKADDGNDYDKDTGSSRSLPNQCVSARLQRTSLAMQIASWANP